MRASVLLTVAAFGLPSCSRIVHTASDVATSRKPEAALKAALEAQGEEYARNPEAAIRDAQALKRDYDRIVALLTGNVQRTWGKREVKLPSRTHYVKYTQNYRSRADVDFDAGVILVETVQETEPRSRLRSAIVTTLLTPNDPRAVDLFTDRPVALTSERKPYLLGLVLDHRGRPVETPADAEAFADRLLSTALETREVELEGGRKTAHFVRIAMVPNLEDEQAEKYRRVVTRCAQRFNVSPSLVYAIIKTESNFNPFAVSPAPAYGLMQLVPTSGGREAYKRARGIDAPPSKQLLLDADSNIELGTAYLSVLSTTHLDKIANPTAREYCLISAYNTGPANVFRTFSHDRVAAVNAINALQPPAVYDRLSTALPYEETRQYLVKVTTARRRYVKRAPESM